MIYIGVGIVILMALLGSLYVFTDMFSRIKKQNKYRICFKESYKRTDLPVVSLKINGKYEWFLVDSGASCNLIKQSYFDTIKDKPKLIENKSGIYTGSDQIKSEYCSFDLSYKTTKFKGEIFNIAQLNVFDINKSKYGMDIVGIVGSPFFNKYKWAIDFERMVIWINK